MMCNEVCKNMTKRTKMTTNKTNEAARSCLLVFFFNVALSLVDAQDSDYLPWSRSGSRMQTITTLLIEPYVMKKNISQYRHVDDLPMNQMYEGYLVDLLEQLSRDVRFSYHLHPRDDVRYGLKRPDGSWNGMIGELVRKEADIAAAPMYMTERRIEVVNFTVPYMYTQATMVMKKASKGGPLGIKHAIDLLYNTDIEFGTLDRGVIKKSFRASNDSLHKKMLQKMNSFTPKAYTKSNAEGIERVRRDSNYIFVIPDTIGRYIASKRPCDISVMDQFLMKEGYSLALQRGSHLLPYIDQALRDLRAKGFLDKIYHKWWVEKADCDIGPSEKSFRSLDYDEVVPQSQGSRSKGSNNSGFLSLNVFIVYWILYIVHKIRLLN